MACDERCAMGGAAVSQRLKRYTPHAHDPEARDASEGEGPQRRPHRRLGRRLEEAAKAVGGGYCWLQMPLRLALGVRGTVTGHGLGAPGGGGGGTPPPLPMHPWPRQSMRPHTQKFTGSMVLMRCLWDGPRHSMYAAGAWAAVFEKRLLEPGGGGGAGSGKVDVPKNGRALTGGGILPGGNVRIRSPRLGNVDCETNGSTLMLTRATSVIRCVVCTATRSAPGVPPLVLLHVLNRLTPLHLARGFGGLCHTDAC